MPFKLKHVFRGVQQAVRHPEQAVKQLVKHLPAVIGAAVGTALGGPAGAVIGGGIGGTTTRGGGNKLKGALSGAGVGAGYASLAPMTHAAISGAGAGSQGLLSSLTGVNQPSLLSQLGVASAPKVGGGLGLFGNLGAKGAVPSFIDSLTGKAAIMGANATAGKGLLAGTGIAGLAKKAAPKIMETLRKSGASYGGGDGGYEHISASSRGLGGFGGFSNSGFYPGQSIGSSPKISDMDAVEKRNVSKIINNPNLTSMEKLMMLVQYLGVEQEHFTGREVEEPEMTFKRGGHVKVKGYIKGSEGGQADNIRTKLNEGDFIIDATTLSLYGDGNSAAGAKRFKKEIESKYKPFKKIFEPSLSKQIDAWVSPGEMRINKEIVSSIGGGDNKKGAKILNSFRNNLREHKGVVKFLPPKSKSFDFYAFKGGSVH